MPLPVITPDPFYPAIPQATDDPADSQALLLSNNGSVNTQFAYDHTALTAGSNNGMHTKISFSGNNPPSAPNTPSGFQSIGFTNPGVADVNASQLYWQNANASYFLSFMKAWAFCQANGSIVSSQSFNITSVTRTGEGTYSVVMPASVVSSENYGVLVTCSNANSAPTTDSVLGGLAIDILTPTATNFVIRTFRKGLTTVDPVRFTFIVIQI